MRFDIDTSPLYPLIKKQEYPWLQKCNQNSLHFVFVLQSIFSLFLQSQSVLWESMSAVFRQSARYVLNLNRMSLDSLCLFNDTGYFMVSWLAVFSTSKIVVCPRSYICIYFCVSMTSTVLIFLNLSILANLPLWFLNVLSLCFSELFE